MKSNKHWVAAVALVGLGVFGVFTPTKASAHCDTLSGPVISAARQALKTDNVNLVLVWVQPADEAAVRAAFAEAAAARQKSDSAKDAAEIRFFETLVRVHRAGEGAPFTGIKPADTDIGPAVPAADRALETGTVEPVQVLLTNAVRQGVEKHFYEVRERRAYDPNDVAAGRAFVKAYVEYTHFVEGVYQATNAAGHHEHALEGAHHENVGPSHSGHNDHLSAARGDHGHSGHLPDGHGGHLPWALAGLFGLAALAEGGWLMSRRKKGDSQ